MTSSRIDSGSIFAAHRASAAARRESACSTACREPLYAISAKRFSAKQRKEGNLTKDEFERINRKADKVLKAKTKD